MTETEAEYNFRRLGLSESEVEDKMRTFRKLSSPAPHQYNATQQVNDIMQDPFCLHAFQLSESEAMFHLRELGLSETEIEDKMCTFRELPPHQSNNILLSPRPNIQVGRGVGNNEPLHQSKEIRAGENEAGEDYILENNDGRFNKFLERNHNAIFREPLGNRRQTFLNYNFRQMPINRDSLYIRLFQILAEGYVFRINLAEAYVLEHDERLELRYFYACPGNTSIIPEAATIRSIEDLDRFLDLIYGLGLLEGTRNPPVERPDTKWRMIMITNVMFIITRTDFLIGYSGGVPKELLTLRSLVSFAHNAKGKTY
ncbi:uncharacterized protein LOC113475493 [Ciona intestinalis]